MATHYYLWCFCSFLSTGCVELVVQPELHCTNGYYRVCDTNPYSATVAIHISSPIRCRVAVLITGVVGRYYPEPTLEHVVKPAAKAGCAVDYYVMLSGKLHEGGFSAYWYRPVTNPRFSNMSWDAFERYLILRASRAGARRVAVYAHNDVALDEFPEDPSWRHAFRSGKKKSAKFIRNVLYLQALELLWNWTKSFRDYHEYSHVAVIRGDIYWLEDLPVDIFDTHGTVYSRPLGHLCTDGWGMDDWPDDRVFVMGGDTAELILTAYSAFLYDKSPELDTAMYNEEFIMKLAKLRGVHWKFVPRDLMAYFAALHMKLPDREPFLCLRGINQKLLNQPTGRCVHPSRISLPFCEDFQLL